jgi:hypothetical protein
VQVNEPGDDVTVNPVSADPPVTEGAVYETVAAPDDVTAAETEVGGFGTVAGVTALEAVEATDM